MPRGGMGEPAQNRPLGDTPCVTLPTLSLTAPTEGSLTWDGIENRLAENDFRVSLDDSRREPVGTAGVGAMPAQLVPSSCGCPTSACCSSPLLPPRRPRALSSDGSGRLSWMGSQWGGGELWLVGRLEAWFAV